MPRICSVCTHSARATIDDGLVMGQSLRAISAAYGLSKSAVDRHKDNHVSVPLAQDDADLAAEFQAARQADRQHYHKLRKNARAVMRAFEGWQSVRTAEAWEQVCQNAHKTYKS